MIWNNYWDYHLKYDDNKGKFIEDSNDITPFFELTDEEKDFLNLKDGFVSSI